MSEETEVGIQTLESSSETNELNFRQESDMDTPVTRTPAQEITVRSVDEPIKQASDLLLRRVDEICALLARRTEMESAGSREASGLRRD